MCKFQIQKKSFMTHSIGEGLGEGFGGGLGEGLGGSLQRGLQSGLAVKVRSGKVPVRSGPDVVQFTAQI